MVNRQDIRTLNEKISSLIDAVDELQELHEQDQNAAITVDPAAYADAQEAVKAAVEVLSTHSDGMVDRTDVLEDDEGNVLVTLPNAALARDGNATTLPSGPQ